MAVNGKSSSLPACGSLLLSTLVLVLGLAPRSLGQAVPSDDIPPPGPSVNLRSLITGTCEDVRQYVESIVGTTVIKSTVECIEMLIRFLAEGAASGLNVIAVYVTEILRVTGVDVKLPFPHFTPEGVASVAQWGLLALIGYWLVTMTLRLLVSTVRRLFWVLKTVAALWMFGLIVADMSAEADVTAVRLGCLVLAYAVLGLVGPAAEKTESLEGRLSSLEGRLSAVEGKGEE